MSFPEPLKASVRARADMRCCVCHAIGVEVHHLIPEAEGGPDIEDNAAPICPSCHETYGANPTKRKFLRESRDAWYATVQHQRQDHVGMASLRAALDQLASRADLAEVKDTVTRRLAEALRYAQRPRTETLGDILAHLYNINVARFGISNSDIDMTHTVCFEGKMQWRDYDEVRHNFVEIFGSQTSRKLCGYCLTHTPVRPGSPSGFTEPEMSEIAREIYITMVLMMNHYEVAGAESPMELGIDPDGSIRGWIAGQRPQPGGP